MDKTCLKKAFRVFRLLESLVATFVLLQLAVCWNRRRLVVAHQTYQTYNTQNAKNINLGQQFFVWGKHTFCTQNLSFLGRLIRQHKDRPPPQNYGFYMFWPLESIFCWNFGRHVYLRIFVFLFCTVWCQLLFSAAALLAWSVPSFVIIFRSGELGGPNLGRTSPACRDLGLGHVWLLRFSKNHEQTWRDEGPSGPSVMKQRHSCSCPIRINKRQKNCFIWGAAGRKIIIDRLLLELNPLN